MRSGRLKGGKGRLTLRGINTHLKCHKIVFFFLCDKNAFQSDFNHIFPPTPPKILQHLLAIMAFLAPKTRT